MKNINTDSTQIWKDFEDLVVPQLQLSVTDRAVYSHLLRHSRLEGKRQLRFSISWLARGACLSGGPVRDAVRRLAAKGVVRLMERSRAGHVVEVRLPLEIRSAGPARLKNRGPAQPRSGDNLENVDFLRSRALRQVIHSREGGRCFYCLSRLNKRVRCLDHVVPRVRFGRNSHRNLVSCCTDCNSQKGEKKAADFLRWLYREGRLTPVELKDRLRALKALGSGKLGFRRCSGIYNNRAKEGWAA